MVTETGGKFNHQFNYNFHLLLNNKKIEQELPVRFSNNAYLLSKDNSNFAN